MINSHMKIGLVSLRWDGHHTPYANLISQSLIELGHEVTLFIPENHKRKKEFDNHSRLEIVEVQSTVAGNSPGYLKYINQNIAYYNQLKNISNCIELDIIHLLTLDILQPPLLLSAIKNGLDTPTVATIHRDHPYRSSNPTNKFSKEKLTSELRKGLQIMVDISTYSLVRFGYIDQLLTHSEELRARLMNGIFRIPSENVTKIPAPTAPLSEDISQEKARKGLDLPLKKPIILFFGEMREEKGPDILVNALEDITQECAIVFAGKEGYVDSSTIEELNTDSQIDIITRFEYIPEDQLASYFISSDLLVLPYRRTKGISGPLRQAVMANTSIIASHPTDIGSIVKENNLGEVFSIGSEEKFASKVNEFLKGNLSHSEKALSTYAEKIHYKSVGSDLIDIYNNQIYSSKIRN
ncbi:glycosyltransferase family 4 protein [Haloarcula nitratireducens]|uniref:Glycosyltransferase family 4 protein n=1 Tax=Haloarcula nitratireducens TaxID=2487749 RepID=A0AAW4PGK5_9EURY|nr:glycosyltransferase family 4 protein [Halomicroarcula nitratireducens]MBX0296666.1 glycosyltransferase family 4 protein [Halomicroarcula nitratireducens]